MGLGFYLAIIALALMLFFPVSNIIWVLSIRRSERKMGQKLTREQAGGQKVRARVIAVVLVLTFAWLFNLQLYSRLYG